MLKCVNKLNTRVSHLHNTVTRFQSPYIFSGVVLSGGQQVHIHHSFSFFVKFWPLVNITDSSHKTSLAYVVIALFFWKCTSQFCSADDNFFCWIEGCLTSFARTPTSMRFKAESLSYSLTSTQIRTHSCHANKHTIWISRCLSVRHFLFHSKI